jgi:hypothetical protein
MWLVHIIYRNKKVVADLYLEPAIFFLDNDGIISQNAAVGYCGVYLFLVS